VRKLSPELSPKQLAQLNASAAFVAVGADVKRVLESKTGVQHSRSASHALVVDAFVSACEGVHEMTQHETDEHQTSVP